jgi:hypothetical protein
MATKHKGTEIARSQHDASRGLTHVQIAHCMPQKLQMEQAGRTRMNLTISIVTNSEMGTR